MFYSIKINKLFLSATAMILTALICLCMISGGVVQVSNNNTDIKICVVMYHGLINDSRLQNKYMISPKHFENDLKYLKENGYNTIVISDLIDYFENGKALPKNPVMLTFDDGYYNNYYYAYPLLKKYKFKAIISPIGYTADDKAMTQNKNPSYSQCDWNDYREMVNSGCIELQNHTFNLHKTKNGRQGAAKKRGEDEASYCEMLKEDLSKFNEEMYKNIGEIPTAFTYPFGAKSDAALKVIKEMGFKAALDCEEKITEIHSKDDLYYIHRFLRPNNMSTQDFFENKLKIGTTKQ